MKIPLLGCEQGDFVYAVKFRDSAKPAARGMTVCRCGQAGVPRIILPPSSCRR